ncbi:PQQ-binding-like beta-propeller repeat protein [Streptomyces botrytidirepellens]|uniref:Serine/threonine protein kinase n=1 Tax=Streptomyces botrytidirepellens TaxID=2486417 RepID=A0A3M8UVM6_9ACTN|nr:PQQ-binding-like beta-propeller repeat protein [Streptomyces botrytidirepellens]RNG09412.1 serine/threonine protein kinase [Streptomyces botrytidirepellens]
MNPLGTGDPLRLGPYRLTGVLGAGGMGQVYLGRDAAGRTAAVKVLRPELAHDPEMARRFLREAYAAQAVRSGGVARVLAAQTEGGRPWIATEFLVGPTLDQAVERYGALSEPAVRALGAALVTTLREIHGAGLVHRDLKPSNIVLTSRGPRIIDFGIARPEHGLTLTTTGQTLATPGYAAPEQVLGRRTGPAGDVFSLGVVLAYAAGGRPVYEGGHVAAVQYQVVHGEPELDAVPEGLRTLVAPCLAKEAADRPVLDALAGQLAPPRGASRVWRTGPLAEDIARREADSRRMATMPGDEPSRTTRRRLLTTLAAGGAVLAAGGGTGAWWLLRDDEAAADGARPWDAKPLAEYDQGVAPSPLWGPVDIGPLDLADKAVPAPLPVHDLVVVPAKDGRLRAYGVRDGKPRWTSKTTGLTGRALAVPGDTEDTDGTGGTVLATDTRGAVRALRAADGTERWKADRADARALLAADDQAVYLTTRDGRIRAVSLASRTTLWTAPGPDARTTPAATAAGGRLVVHGAGGKVTGHDTSSGKPVWHRDGQGSTPLTPAVADGTVYLGGRTLAALSLADGKEKWARTASGDLGWSAPAVRDGVVHAVDATDLTARQASDGSDIWSLPVVSEQHPLAPPVVQGNSVWAMIDDFGQRGIVAVDARRGSVAWPYAQGGAGSWRLTGAGNRVFLLHNEKLTAMPVF